LGRAEDAIGGGLTRQVRVGERSAPWNGEGGVLGSGEIPAADAVSPKDKLPWFRLRLVWSFLAEVLCDRKREVIFP
jgi:hypothetical protein